MSTETDKLTSTVDRQIFIDTNPYRTRTVLMENGKVAEIYSENNERSSIVGNIFRGRVAAVLPGMSAAFIDIGMDKNAFFSLRDLEKRADQLSQDGDELAPVPKVPTLKNGQELIVQVVKDPQGTKAARVSTQISISGHLLVLFPLGSIIGISRNITDDAERERLRSIVEATREDGMGVIVRTAAQERDDETIAEELRHLTAKWKSVLKAYNGSNAPKCLLREYGLVERTLRDLLRPNVSKVIVNDTECYDAICSIADEIEPGASARITFYENEPNLFEMLGIEKQIDEALSRKVYLKSGAYIVIDHTEALVSIDVNSGKNIGRTNLQQTALATNCEAAVEIARQLRLRNIGGMIIIDFIDLESKEDRITVVRTLKNALMNDRIACIVHGMTVLGLVEVTRKKLRDNLASYVLDECPCCHGLGKVQSPENVALRLRARLISRLLSGGSRRVSITAAPSVIRLIKKYAAQERRRYGFQDVELILNESHSGDTDDFDIHFLSN